MAGDPALAALTHPSPGPERGPDQELQKIYAEELKAAQRITLSVDLVLAAKRQLGFLRTIDSLPCLHRGPAVLRAIQRYQNCWMPLAADALKFDAALNADAKGKCLLPPLDVQWVWHCHCLNPVGYREYCTSKYGRVIDFPLLPDVASEALAQERCKRLWSIVFPKEPFDIMASLCKLPGSFGTPNQVFPIEEFDGLELEELVAAVARQSSFYYQVSQPYMWEETFLQAAKERYKCFLHILYKSQGKILCVPTFDIDLMWHSHQLAPVAYAKDTKALLGCIVDHDDTLERGPGTKLGHGFEDTVRLWESSFGNAYERAGSMYRGSKPVNLPAPPASEVTGSTHVLESVPAVLPWDHRITDQNPTKYPGLVPRHILQVCILIKGATNMMPVGRENADLFVRLKALDAHKLLKLDTPALLFTPDPQWQKLWLLQCEARTKGVVLELRYHVEGCLRTLHKTKRVGGVRLTWQELQKAPTLSHEALFTLREKRFSSDARKPPHPLHLRLAVSITPPVQAPYLLKSVPDRVTDDRGAMLSSIIVRMRRNEPQSGRWISRTVFNHVGKETFVIRIRAAKGIWKKNGDRPVGVDWNERIINVHEGGWNYVANSIGIAPEKIVGTALPLAHELEEYKLSWALSTGDTLIISRQMGDLEWERHLEFTLKTSGADAGLARLLNGRKLQYEVPGATSEEEEGFVTLIRYSPQAPQGKATALFNFKVSAMEVLPEEDVLLVLLLCTATLRSIADFGGLTSGNVHTRQRAKENRPGLKDWGSVVLENSNQPSNLACWYLNCGEHRDEDEGDGEDLPGRVGVACGSSCRAANWGGSDQGAGTAGMGTPVPAAAEAHEAATEATTGVWGRRTGSGIQVNAVQIKRASSIT